MCPPELLFIPDASQDDVPDGPPLVVLDGFTVPTDSYHGMANGLRFGPDGWIYGRCGASVPAEIGAPATGESDRIPLRGGMWRYHPIRKVFEALTSGTTNPWGHDWNEFGELLFVNTVNGHLWHAFPGAHFVRSHTIDPNPFVYSLIDQHADHWHFDTAQDWTKSRDGAANEFGGGHAHVGAMIYLGDNWPTENRGHLFTLNFHGRRMNQEILERHGSGYVGRHGEDAFCAQDKWFRGLELGYGPDGGVFVLDWSDAGECHERSGVHRTSGRIYKITHGDPQPSVPVNLAKSSLEELVTFQSHANEWFVRQARTELAERFESGLPTEAAADALKKLFLNNNDPLIQFRAMMGMRAVGAADDNFLLAQLKHPNEHLRAWAIRLLTDAWTLDTVLSKRPKQEISPKAEVLSELVAMAKNDASGLVRLVLASTLQRCPVSRRIPLASALVTHAEDAEDHNLPALVWCGLIPVGADSPGELVALFNSCRWPKLRHWIARRLAGEIEKRPGIMDELLASVLRSGSQSVASDVIEGLADGFTGWRKASRPARWNDLCAMVEGMGDAQIRQKCQDLSVLFGDGRALDDVRNVALDPKASLAARQAALQTIIESRPDDLRTVCEKLLSVRFLNPIAAKGLALFDDPSIGPMLVKAYGQFHESDRPQLISTMVSRPSLAMALLDAVGKGSIPRSVITPFQTRQLQSLGSENVVHKLDALFGQSRPLAADKLPVIAKWKKILRPETSSQADSKAGRAIYASTCAVCHTLYGEGGKLAPDLTGAGRDNLDYLLENIIDPSAVVNPDFRMSILKTKDGRVLTGMVREKTDRTLVLQSMTDKTTIERSEIESLTESPSSIMPEGFLDALTESQVRDLMAYLMTKQQVPLPAAAK